MAAGRGRERARPRYLGAFLARLPRSPSILELGCGGGGPTTARVAAAGRYVGVDISAGQLHLARRNLTGAAFIQCDMTRLGFAADSFDGVAAFHSLTHLPQGELPALLGRVARWLRPGGVFVASLGAHHDPGTVEADWLGAPMYFSGYSVDENEAFLREAGLTIEVSSVDTLLESGQPVPFFWVLTRKPSSV